MIIGIGIDLIELNRIERLLRRQPRFVERVLTERERERNRMLSQKRQVEYVAGRFAAKEAFSKAVGTGISEAYSWQDIEVLNEANGQPVLRANVDATVHISISHSESYAIAQVILERLSS